MYLQHDRFRLRPFAAAPSRSRSSGATPPSTRLWTRLVPIALALGLSASIAAQEPPPTAMAREQAAGKNPSEATFQVVVNAANPTTELPAAKVARMFLKKLKRWDHGIRVLPADLDANSPIRKAFTKSVHGKSVTAINSFWQRMIFSGRDVPPEEKSSEKDILDFVRANPGAIGYVGAETPLGDGVKKLGVTQ